MELCLDKHINIREGENARALAVGGRKMLLLKAVA